MNDNMPSVYAKHHARPVAPFDVVFVVYPDIVLLDLAGPLQVFTHARKVPQTPAAYRKNVVSARGGTVGTNTLLSIHSDPIDDWLAQAEHPAIHTLVVIGGDGAIPAARDPAFIQQVQQLAAKSRRVCSVCSGALVLAAAGLLDGRRAVTHWEDCDRLAADNPRIMVEVDPIYIKDGDIWTSAGITAGIDMALAIIAEDLGKPAAIKMARSLVRPMVRSGGQSQFSPDLDRQARDTQGRFDSLHEWINANLARRLTVEDLAARCAMSARNFSRQYTVAMGIPPAKAVEAIRVEVARSLLATTDLGVQGIAVRCGFSSDEGLRRAFLRQIKTSPTAYRKQFR